MKIASREADPLPAPRPYREIFVWSPDVEGVHLRFGPVARGGLRWSDRRDDFRTEVLGLVKAQQVKNAVIVPVGSKGGFYPKSLPAKGTREEIQAAGIAAYKTFVGALLQITDNIVDGKTVHPPGVVAWDGEDPYLVVAADKGTATFSDIANGLSADYNFWLGDAFASGGSVGYDHKKMGITARGAWEAVKRHFREMGQRHAEPALLRHRHRRHVGRRVRQRHAAVEMHQPARGVRPPPHLPRSQPHRSRSVVQRAPAHVRPAALVVGGLQRDADLQRRRHLRALGQVDPAVARRSRR